MPTVPFAQPRPATRPPVDPIFEAIAVADLHEAGMLFESEALGLPIERVLPASTKPEGEA